MWNMRRPNRTPSHLYILVEHFFIILIYIIQTETVKFRSELFTLASTHNLYDGGRDTSRGYRT